MKFEFRKTILFISISMYLILNVNAVTTYDSDWTHKEDITLEWGDNYSTGNYSIIAEDFNRQAVQLILTIYKNNEKISTEILSANETIEISTIKIIVNTVGGCEGATATSYAKLTIHTMEPPAINLDATYNLTKEGLGNISINLENTGGIRFSNITLNLDLPEDFILYRDKENKYQTSFDSVNPKSSDYILTSMLENVSVGSKASRWVKIEAPVLPQEIKIPIRINAQGYDLDNALLNVSRDMNLTIKPSIIMKKATLNRSLNTAEDYFNINDRFYVMISISNRAITEADNIKLNETLMNSNFVLDPDSPLVWSFNLPGLQSRSFVYYLRPVCPGEVKVSTTKVSREYKGLLYESSIDPTTVMIYGPYFEISKTLDKYVISPGETVSVTVTAENKGNHAAFLTLSDEIPSFSQFVNGSLNDGGMVLKPGENITKNHLLTIEELGDFRFPSAIGQYSGRHDNGIVYSTRPMIHVSKPTPTPTPTPTMTPASNNTTDHNESNNTGESDSSNIPGFSVITSLVILILFYFGSKMKKN